MSTLKYSLSSRQEHKYLLQANEIRVMWNDRNIIYDLCEKYPAAKINLVKLYSHTDIVDWNELSNFIVLSRNQIIFGFSDVADLDEARRRGLPHYCPVPVRTFAELEDYKRAGVCRVYLTAPLFFEMDKVQQFDIPVAAVANQANPDALFARPDGVTGTWIRPEDIELYEPYIEVIEFMGDRKQEQALFRIYAERQEWSGDLNLIIPDLNYPCTNRMIPPTLAQKRLNCGQRCKSGGACKLCYRLMTLAQPDLLRPLKEQI